MKELQLAGFSFNIGRVIMVGGYSKNAHPGMGQMAGSQGYVALAAPNLA
jgi:hypothetical protein